MSASNDEKHENKWKRIVQFEGGAKTSMPPEFLRGLRDYRTEKCKWRITYEEMIDDE